MLQGPNTFQNNYKVSGVLSCNCLLNFNDHFALIKDDFHLTGPYRGTMLSSYEGKMVIEDKQTIAGN